MSIEPKPPCYITDNGDGTYTAHCTQGETVSYPGITLDMAKAFLRGMSDEPRVKVWDAQTQRWAGEVSLSESRVEPRMGGVL